MNKREISDGIVDAFVRIVVVVGVIGVIVWILATNQA